MVVDREDNVVEDLGQVWPRVRPLVRLVREIMSLLM